MILLRTTLTLKGIGSQYKCKTVNYYANYAVGDRQDSLPLISSLLISAFRTTAIIILTINP